MSLMKKTINNIRIALYSNDSRFNETVFVEHFLKNYNLQNFAHLENLQNSKQLFGEIHSLASTLKTGEFNALVISNIKELCLHIFSEDDLYVFLSTLSQVNIRFISLEDRIDISTSQAQFILFFMKIFKSNVFSSRSENVRRGIQSAKESGKTLGRPTKRNIEKIKDLREKGFTMQKIADRLRLSVGSVHRTLASNN